METHGNSSRMEFEIYHLYKKNIWREKVETPVGESNARRKNRE